ncbi:MAG: hypothetical protein JJE21_00025 [Spirochaetaceae bacterium]|nr:hypothetical protein [Spirochaetaceae bacterium]
MSKTRIGGFISLALMIGTSFLPISIVFKVLIILVIVAFDFYNNRPLLYFVQANKNIMSKKDKSEKAWVYYEKAFNTGKLETKYLITMGNVVAQKGDPNFALKILNTVLERDNTELTLLNQAKVQKSMVLELTGKINEGIVLLQEVRESGYNDKSLYINLACYLLYVDNKKEAANVLDEGIEFEDINAGALDNRGWLYILEDDWKNASKLYIDMIDRKPTFPDPYVHAAQVKLHYNKVSEAIELLKTAITMKFNKVAFFKKEIIEEMISGLSEKKPDLYVAILNTSVVEIAKGLKPKDINKDEAKTLITKTFEEEPIFDNESKIESIDSEEPDEEVVINTNIDSDGKDDFPNTELTDDDAEWEKNHK